MQARVRDVPQNSTDRVISPPPPASNKRKRATEEDQYSSQVGKLSIWSWNVNGIAPFLQATVTSYFKPVGRSEQDRPSTKASLRHFLRRNNWPTLLFLQEVKINPSDLQTIRAVERAVRKESSEPDDAHDYEAHFCLPSDKHNARGFGGRVYGVCTVIRRDFSNKFVERVRPVNWDAEGRFLVVETRMDAALGMPKLAIINVYAVNGTDNPYKDPLTGAISGTRHDRKLQVHSLLQAECRRLVDEGFEFIVAGDINIARTPLDGRPNLRTFPTQHCINRADFEAKFMASADSKPGDGSTTAAGGLGMIDTFRCLHPDKRGYTYYPRTKAFGTSCDRVDMILASPSLKDALVAAGMQETPQARGPSDHVPLYAEFAFKSP